MAQKSNGAWQEGSVAPAPVQQHLASVLLLLLLVVVFLLLLLLFIAACYGADSIYFNCVSLHRSQKCPWRRSVPYGRLVTDVVLPQAETGMDLSWSIVHACPVDGLKTAAFGSHPEEKT